jgi:hypothetical protein
MSPSIFRRLLVVSAAAAVVLPALGSAQSDEWRAVGESEGKKFYVKRSSMTREGDIASAAVKENYFQPQPAGKKGKTYLSAKNRYRINCAEGKVAFQKMEAFAQADLQGEVVQKVSYKDKNLTWLVADAGTMNGQLLTFVCSETSATAAH